jgi:hypothetical protein
MQEWECQSLGFTVAKYHAGRKSSRPFASLIPRTRAILKTPANRLLFRDMGYPIVRALLLVAALLQTPTARQLQSGIVKGALRTNAGFPIQGMRVAVEPVENTFDAGVLESIGMTDKEGRYVLENVSPGRYHIVAGRLAAALYHPGVPEARDATTIIVVAGQTTEVADMVFNRLNVSGRIVDMNSGRGRRIESLYLCCTMDTPSTSASGAFNIRTIALLSIAATVNDDGAFFFSSVPAGTYYLHASDPTIVPLAQVLTVGADDVKDVEMRITNGVRVTGLITDRLKLPVSQVNVTLKADPGNTLLEGKRSPVAPVASLMMSSSNAVPPTAQLLPALVLETKPRMMPAAANGSFAFQNVLPGRYTLEVNAPGGNAFSRQIEVGTQELLSPALEVPFTQVQGRIIVADGSALPRLTGSVRFVSSDPDAKVLYGFPDGMGQFSVLVTPGEYRILTDGLSVDRSIETITENSVDLRTHSIAVDGTRTQEIKITIVP